MTEFKYYQFSLFLFSCLLNGRKETLLFSNKKLQMAISLFTVNEFIQVKTHYTTKN